MKTLRSQTLVEKENGDYLVAEIVEDVTPEEREGFELYELQKKEDLNEEEKIKLSYLVKKYLRSYSKHKDEMSLKDWLFMMFREDFPKMKEEEVESMATKVLEETEQSYLCYKKVKQAGELGIAPQEYFARQLEKQEGYEKLEAQKEELLDMDQKLTDEAVDQLYTLNRFSSAAAKTIGQAGINQYMGNIDQTIAAANENMMDTILRKDGGINLNPNLDGFMAESYHANTFNIDAAVKELKLKAQDLKPDVYGKNSVDIVIKDMSKGKGEIVAKYQAKFGKDAAATAEYFKDADGNYKYRFQQKLVGEDQVEDVSNAVSTVKYEGAESQGITKEEIKKMQEEVQAGDIDAAKLSFEDVSTRDLMKQVGYKAVRNTIYAGAISAGLHMGVKVIQGEEIEADEVLATAVKTGGAAGVTTAVHGAMTTAAKKGILKGVMAKSTFISAVAFSCIEALSVVAKVGSGELSFKEGLDSLGEVFTAGLLISGTMGSATAGGAITSLAGMMGAAALATTVATVVVGGVVAVAGTALAKPVYQGAKAVVGAVVSGAKTVVSAGVGAIKSVASCAWEGVKSVGSCIASGFSSVCSTIGGWFGF